MARWASLSWVPMQQRSMASNPGSSATFAQVILVIQAGMLAGNDADPKSVSPFWTLHTHNYTMLYPCHDVSSVA
jgi:hypothetical protein